MEHTPEELEYNSFRETQPEEKEHYTERPKSHLILAWIAIAVVLFAFLGMCYWMVAY